MNRSASAALSLPRKPVSEIDGNISRARDADARVGGDELLLGLDQVGAAQQQLGGQARGHDAGAAASSSKRLRTRRCPR